MIGYRLADGLALAAAARRARDPRAARLADARLLRRVHGGPGAADRGRRRRGADLRDRPPAPRPGWPGRRLGAARAGARRRGHARRSPRSASRSRSASYDVGAYLWIEAVFVLGTIVLGGRLLLDARVRPLLAKTVPLLRADPRRAPDPRRLRGHPRLPRPPGLLFGVFTLTLAHPDDPRARDLVSPARRSASTSRRGRTT